MHHVLILKLDKAMCLTIISKTPHVGTIWGPLLGLERTNGGWDEDRLF